MRLTNIMFPKGSADAIRSSRKSIRYLNHPHLKPAGVPADGFKDLNLPKLVREPEPKKGADWLIPTAVTMGTGGLLAATAHNLLKRRKRRQEQEQGA